LISDSEARKIWYFLANFLMSFLFLLNAFSPSAFLKSRPRPAAFSQWKASPGEG
jgi:hypothetical protein|tara:strand:- start:535 stop:696 length:162 start_codon:yes stop_codon:yes gene_type:complete